MALKGFDKKLSFSDFQKVDNRPMDADGTESAQIHPDLAPSNFKIRRNGTEVSIEKFDLTLRLISQDCWMLSAQYTDADLLHHEQGHYDIATIAGREMYNRLLACKTSSVEALQTEMDTIKREVDQNWTIVDKRYDTKTNHGANADIQKQWDEKISSTRKDPKGVLNNLPL